MANPFPDIYPDGPDGWQPDLKELQARDLSPNGILQINAFDPVEQFFAKGSWKLLSGVEIGTTLRGHFTTNKYSTTGFSLFDYFIFPWTGLPCGTGDGVKTVFTIPAKQTSAQTVKDNGGAAGANTILVGTGPDGEDQISFTTPPANGHVITIDCTGRRRFTVLYVTEVWSPRWSGEADIWIIELEFIEKVN